MLGSPPPNPLDGVNFTMKRFCLISSVAAMAAVSLPATADAEPAILYIPTEATTLYPAGAQDTPCAAVSLGDYNAGLGCLPAALTDGETMEPAYADAAALTAAFETALADFDVMVTNTRPVDYLPYYILLASDMESAESTNPTCAGAPLTCAGRGRNGIAFTNGGTMACTDPDDAHAALYAFGRMAGLEGKVAEMGMMVDPDPMDYPPDYTNPATAFQDRCSDRAQQLGGEDGMTPQPLECTSADHVMCDNMQQNSYQDLLSYFGTATMDADAPTITVNSPAMGDVVPEDGALNISVSVADADPIVGVKIIVTSPALEGVFDPPQISACTNNQCDVDFLEGNPFKPSSEAFEVPAIEGLPGGEYTITFEAADYHGNIAEMQTITLTIEGGPVGGTDGGSDTGDSATTDDSASGGSGITGAGSTGEDTDDGSSGGTAGGDEDDSGCSCTTQPRSGGAAVLLLGLLGLGLGRRRRR